MLHNSPESRWLVTELIISERTWRNIEMATGTGHRQAIIQRLKFKWTAPFCSLFRHLSGADQTPPFLYLNILKKLQFSSLWVTVILNENIKKIFSSWMESNFRVIQCHINIFKMRYCELNCSSKNYSKLYHDVTIVHRSKIYVHCGTLITVLQWF